MSYQPSATSSVYLSSLFHLSIASQYPSEAMLLEQCYFVLVMPLACNYSNPTIERTIQNFGISNSSRKAGTIQFHVFNALPAQVRAD